MLEELRRLVGCVNISDLRYGHYLDEARDFFKNMDYSEFKVNDVMDTFHYIHPNTDHICTIEQMITYIDGTSD